MKQIEHVNHPSHYNRGGIEAIEVIEAWGLGFNLGNTIKYISRAGFKNPAKKLEDLKKARWYLNREIDNMEGDALVRVTKGPKPTLDDLQQDLFEEANERIVALPPVHIGATGTPTPGLTVPAYIMEAAHGC